MGLKLSDDEIGSMSKNRFRELVKQKINQLALDTFIQDKLNHSKGNEASYDNLGIQKYLKSDQLTTSQKSLLHQLRFKMIKVRANYRNMYEDVQCRWCDEEENQGHKKPDTYWTVQKLWKTVQLCSMTMLLRRKISILKS